MKLKIAVFLGVLAFNAISGLIWSQFLPGTERLFRVVVVAGDALMIATALTCLMRNRSFYVVRYFVLFLFASAITVLYNLDAIGVVPQLNGLRQPLFLLATLIVAHDILSGEYAAVFVTITSVALLFFAIVQLPLTIIQFLEFGPGDEVGGTYGTSGGSGFVTQLLFLTVFYLIVLHGSSEDRTHFSVKKIFLYSLLLLPCALNETKIAFIYLPAFFVILMVSRRKAYKAIPVLALGTVLMYFLASYYSDGAITVDNLVDERWLEQYLVYNPRPGIDIPRFQKIVLMVDLLKDDPMQMVFGMGNGLFSGDKIIGVTKVTRSLFYFQGTRVQLNTTWIQGGLAAVVILVLASLTFLWKGEVRSPVMRRFAFFMAFVIVTTWLYNDAIYDRTFAGIVSFLICWVGTGGLDDTGEESGEEAEEVTEEMEVASA